MTAPRSFETLVELAAQLRAPDGCPWDREQTHESMLAYLVEEAYEVVYAVRSKNNEALVDELGDLLFHIAFHAQLGQESNSFTFQEIVDAAHQKIIRRHPHVFEQNVANDMASVRERWEVLKNEEKSANPPEENSFPALLETRKLLEKADNLNAELGSANRNEIDPQLQIIRDHLQNNHEAAVDFLVGLVDLCGEVGIDPEIALKERNKLLRSELETTTTDR